MEHIPSQEEINNAEETMTEEQREASEAREEARKELSNIEKRVGELEITETGEVKVRADEQK
ncbi:hypothetical protein A2Z10_03785 [Candidatus Azambacteria bacterium RBG_16_47_10]|uniref:Uncharacterized protein n=1 Tax=Candidatus Azambacteria bacterium RBG_16_47_10 TaxID=1797292 RepID=A0A1F5AXU6_9BACT|nr:MAG: hypothetical protein A2Z10_03785 [Candidatus Azambacteria bacterium RBG_16_47_10]